MPDRLLATMFGGLSDFVTQRDKMQEAERIRKQREELHDQTMQEGGFRLRALKEDETNRPIDRAYTEFKRTTELTGGADPEKAVDAYIRANPQMAPMRGALLADATRKLGLQKVSDRVTQNQGTISDNQVKTSGFDVASGQAKTDALAKIAAAQAAGTFKPQTNPEHRDWAVAAQMPGLGGPTHQQTVDEARNLSDRQHNQAMGRIQAQTRAQNELADRNLPLGLSPRQHATISFIGDQMASSVEAAMKEINAVKLKIAGNLTVKRGGKVPTDIYTGAPVEGVGGTPQAAQEQIQLHQARVRQLAESLRRDAANLIKGLVATEGMSQGQATQIARDRIKSLLSIVPPMQVQDTKGNWYDVDTQYDVLDQLNLLGKGEYKSRNDPSQRAPAIYAEPPPAAAGTQQPQGSDPMAGENGGQPAASRPKPKG